MKKNIFFKFILFLCFIILSSNLYSQESDSSKNIININSEPEGAEVFLNNSLIGKTPLTLKNQSPGKLAFLIKLDDKKSFSETVHYNGGEMEIYPLFNYDHSVLEIITSPDNALVYFNDSIIGTTPIYNFIAPLGINKINIKKEDYVPIEKQIIFFKKKYRWDINLTYAYGFINSNDNGLNIQLKVNGIEIQNDTQKSFKSSIGMSTFEVQWKNEKYLTKEFIVRPEIYYKVIYKTGYFSPTHMFESTAIPGLGQFMDNSKIKGTAFFLATLTSGCFYLIENAEYKNHLGDYNVARVNYENSSTELEALQLREITEKAAYEVNSSIKRKNILLGCFIGLYFINILDSYFFHAEGFDLDLIEIDNSNLGKSATQLKINVPLN